MIRRIPIEQRYQRLSPHGRRMLDAKKARCYTPPHSLAWHDYTHLLNEIARRE